MAVGAFNAVLNATSTHSPLLAKRTASYPRYRFNSLLSTICFRYKQSLFLSTACNYGDEETLAEAQKIFNDWMTNNKT